MFSREEKRGENIVTQFDTTQSDVWYLSLSSICIHLTFSNLALPFPVSDRPAVACWLWMSAESMHRESGAHYGSPWMHCPLKGDRHAVLKHGLLWFGNQDLLSLGNYFAAVKNNYRTSSGPGVRMDLHVTWTWRELPVFRCHTGFWL